MGFFKDIGNFASTIMGSGNANGGGFRKFIDAVSPFVPIAGGIASNIVAGMNERKARLYNSPVNQVKRLREAGLPLAAGSNINAGGGVSTKVADMGTSGFNQNLGASITRQIDRKRVQILQQELRQQKYAADLAEGNLKNQLNPSGQFENTNQGTSLSQTIGIQSEALKNAETVNKWMPIEKAQGILKGTKEIDLVSSQIKNNLVQNGILISESKIKSVLAKYQPDMSLQQLQGLIKDNLGKDLDNIMRGTRNEGMGIDNSIKRIAYNIEWQTQVARIKMAQLAAEHAGYTTEAARLANILTNASLPSTQAYYEIRRGMDEGTLAKPNLPNTLLYLGMFQPNTSNYNFGQLANSIR